jgi:hypothetical protein
MLGSVLLALLDSAKNARDFTHKPEDIRAGHVSQEGGQCIRFSPLPVQVTFS